MACHQPATAKHILPPTIKPSNVHHHPPNHPAPISATSRLSKSSLVRAYILRTTHNAYYSVFNRLPFSVHRLERDGDEKYDETPFEFYAGLRRIYTHTTADKHHLPLVKKRESKRAKKNKQTNNAPKANCRLAGWWLHLEIIMMYTRRDGCRRNGPNGRYTERVREKQGQSSRFCASDRKAPERSHSFQVCNLKSFAVGNVSEC